MDEAEMSREGASLDTRQDRVGSLEKGLSVIEILAGHPTGLTLTEVAGIAGLTRAGARRLLLSIVAAGFAEHEGRTFRLSPKIIALSRQWLAGSSLWTFAEPFMRRVSEALNESCSAAILSGEEVVYVQRVTGARIVGVALHVGTRLPAFCTSMGRVLLADLSAEALDTCLSGPGILPRNEKTVVDPARLRELVERAGRDGYAVVDEELEIGLRSIAVPVRDRSGRAVAAINVATQSGRMSVRELEDRALPELRRAAARIEDFFVVQ
jgi:IclR family pca regulon transcriptional regulator